MITQDELVAARSRDWRELDGLLGEGGAIHRADGPTLSRIASLYRSLCTDLMRSRAAGFAPDLVAYLDALAARGHAALYSAAPFRTAAVVAFIARDFPRALRKNWRFFAIAWALFLLPCLAGAFGAITSDDFVARVLPASMIQSMAESYAKGFGAGRDAATSSGMAGFYVYNNVGIAFRCFATGALFGTGSLFFLVYNGLLIGTTVGYVVGLGHGGNILTFMCGHAPFELTAIVIAGAAGLQMGYALVDTGGLTRTGSLRRKAPEIASLVLGAAIMLLVAAMVEGFWSPSSAPPPLKWFVAIANTLAVAIYLGLAGRERAR